MVCWNRLLLASESQLYASPSNAGAVCTLATVGVFVPGKLADAINQSFLFLIDLVYQHTVGLFQDWTVLPRLLYTPEDMK